jgi:hypothetical protein
VAKPSHEPQGRLIGPVWDENLDVTVRLDYVRNDPGAHALRMRRTNLIKNEGATAKAEANASNRDMVRLRLGLLSRLVSCNCSTLDGQRVYYNHIRPHQGLDGKTPAQAAGLELDLGANKWQSLIKKASQNISR